jgi:Predicted membrane protein (DUF2142)
MPDSAFAAPRRALGKLRNTERSTFWTSFAVSLLMSLCWIFATPIFGAPDEPAHSIRAYSVAHLEILGRENEKHDLKVDAPLGYSKTGGSITCYAFFESIPASCEHVSNDTKIVPLTTAAGRHTPFYYFAAGLPTLLLQNGKSVFLMRLVSALITAFFVAASVASLRRLRQARAACLGLAVALTPLVWFVSGTVNPSAAEIAGGLGLWTAGGVLALRARNEVDGALVRRAALGAIVLCLSRQLGPAWLLATAFVLAIAAGWEGVKRIWASRSARLWGIGVAAAAVTTLLWNFIVKPVQPRAEEMMNVSTWDAAWESLADTFNRYKEIVGWFGWLDAPPTDLMVTVFSIALVGLAALAFVYGKRRLWWLGMLTALGTVLAPVVFEAYGAHDLGYFWQSRYTLPIAVGVPLMFGFSLAARDRTPSNARAVNIGVIVVGALMAVHQVLGFGNALRRNTVGLGPTDTFDFFLDPIWKPPFPAWFLMLGIVVATAAFYYWLVGVDPSERSASVDSSDADGPAVAVG